MKKYILLSLLIIVNLKALSAQVLLKKVTLKDQIEKSSFVVEGQVIGKQSFWDANHEKIYTVNTVEVFKVFKGEVKAFVDVITLGGVIDNEAQIVSPSLDLKLSDVGVFTLHDYNGKLKGVSNVSNNVVFSPYGLSQAFYKYDFISNLASNQLITKQGIESTLYKEIESSTKTKFVEVSKFSIKNKLPKQTSAKLFDVANFYPTTISAGTKSILTITGSDFGSIKGKVGFRNADNAGGNFIDALDTQVLTWTDIQIEVEVPSQAGTGELRITLNNGSSYLTDNALKINYAQNNIVSNGIAYPAQLVDDNGNGGYTWQMSAHLAQTKGVKEAFKLALDTWSCETKMNWELDEDNLATNSNAIHKAINDNKNVISFDSSESSNPEEQLPDLVLGQRTSYYVSCSETINGVSRLVWYVKEFDIVFDGDADWNFSLNPPSTVQFDFQSVALHELGHCRQIDHVIDTNDLMHFEIAKEEVLRTLNNDNIEAAALVQASSTSQPICSQPILKDSPKNCSLSIQDNNLSTSVKMYPNPTNGNLFISHDSSINIEKIVVYDVSGRFIYNNFVKNSSGPKAINLKNASKGMYFVDIYSGNTVLTKKLLID
ncbi:T9SS type A sorting domain-containing protein [Algibacter pectinivorans]|uniref:Por secretion system C-terminal sorting domain-containing protein n=1 Tax=Algibacter pectinivorans TaxID=870482 RepID=A0A1I1N693_9FLAO|nr:T9SS type A sorting domain-containing protein [Algibacter pectinivorans]SFC92856.1 Por secretion system C-terminal sorting domain-containing protein [Algibacter pectinivorans]